MAKKNVVTNGLANRDKVLTSVLAALDEYKEKHSKAIIDAYRQNSASLRIRIIDPDFGPLERIERHRLVWRILEKLSEEVLSQVSLLLLLSPEEAKKSLTNAEFENPIPSRL
jgi:stress-induced morphogen